MDTKRVGRPAGPEMKQLAANIPAELWDELADFTSIAGQQKQALLAMAILKMIDSWSLAEVHEMRIKLKAWLENPQPNKLRRELTAKSSGTVGGRRQSLRG